MNELFLIICATSLVSVVGLVGVFALFFKRDIPARIIRLLIAFSSGVLLGETFIHLIPEGIENLDVRTFGLVIIATLIGYFVLEKTIHWHHHNDDGKHSHNKAVGYVSLLGDAFHNFVDGLVIASAFLVSVPLGISTTIAIMAHEIPQELADYAIMIHSGFSKKFAAFSNFIVALIAVFGGIVGYFAASQIAGVSHYFLPIAAGGFLYISVSDLMPSIKHESKGKEWWVSLFFVILGVVVMMFLD